MGQKGKLTRKRRMLEVQTGKQIRTVKRLPEVIAKSGMEKHWGIEVGRKR